MVDGVAVREARVGLDGGERPVAPEADERLEREQEVEFPGRGRPRVQRRIWGDLGGVGSAEEKRRFKNYFRMGASICAEER